MVSGAPFEGLNEGRGGKPISTQAADGRDGREKRGVRVGHPKDGQDNGRWRQEVRREGIVE